MDITQIIITVLGLTSLSGLSVFVFYKQNKAGAVSQVTDKLLGNIVQQNDVFKGLLESKDKTIEQLYSIVEDKNVMLQRRMNDIDKIKKESIERGYQLSRITRQVEGVQKQLDIDKTILKELQQRVFYAESNICLVPNCEMRKPKLGEYKHKLKE